MGSSESTQESSEPPLQLIDVPAELGTVKQQLHVRQQLQLDNELLHASSVTAVETSIVPGRLLLGGSNGWLHEVMPMKQGDGDEQDDEQGDEQVKAAVVTREHLFPDEFGTNAALWGDTNYMWCFQRHERVLFVAMQDNSVRVVELLDEGSEELAVEHQKLDFKGPVSTVVICPPREGDDPAFPPFMAAWGWGNTMSLFRLVAPYTYESIHSPLWSSAYGPGNFVYPAHDPSVIHFYCRPQTHPEVWSISPGSSECSWEVRVVHKFDSDVLRSDGYTLQFGATGRHAIFGAGEMVYVFSTETFEMVRRIKLTYRVHEIYCLSDYDECLILLTDLDRRNATPVVYDAATGTISATGMQLPGSGARGCFSPGGQLSCFVCAAGQGNREIPDQSRASTVAVYDLPFFGRDAFASFLLALHSPGTDAEAFREHVTFDRNLLSVVMGYLSSAGKDFQFT